MLTKGDRMSQVSKGQCPAGLVTLIPAACECDEVWAGGSQGGTDGDPYPIAGKSFI